MTHTAALLWGCLVAPGTHAATPQETASIETETRSAAVTATTEVITIDGVLDEPIWSLAPKIGNLIQRQPVPGETPTEATEVTLLYDQDNLYIGVVAYDSEPQRVIGTLMARDANLRSDDRIEILLDTFRDQRNAFYFATNPSGALVDGLTFANGELNTDWDAIWDVRTRRTERGWFAEFAIPFKSLNFPPIGPCGDSTSPVTFIESWRRFAGRALVWKHSSCKSPRAARSRISKG